MTTLAPFPYFGGKRAIAHEVWRRFGNPTHYIEPFCGSAAVLLARQRPGSLEVVGDTNGFIANFWRSVKHQPRNVAQCADYPVSHIDLGARHQWLKAHREELGRLLQDPDWEGDAKAAGWWLWGQCCWIGSGWCDGNESKISDAGRGVQAIGQIPHISNAGRGVQAIGRIPHISNADFLTASGQVAWKWISEISKRLERVRIIHGDWKRCLNNHFGGNDTAIFMDPPYEDYQNVYSLKDSLKQELESWVLKNEHLRIALCGLRGEYALPDWDQVKWSRTALTYGSSSTTNLECIWYSPACLPAETMDLFEWNNAA